MKRVERTFASKLAKASPAWHTFENEQGRVVTNAYKTELKELEELSGVPCEIVHISARKPRILVQIGPKLPTTGKQS